MRRFTAIVLIATSLLMGTLSLNGCIVAPPYHHGHAGHRDGPDHRHDRDRDRGRHHDNDRRGDRGH